MSDCLKAAGPDVLRRLLDDGLTDAEQVALAAHLEACPPCCRRLDAMAAKSGYWSDLRRLNNDNDLGRSEPTDADTAGLVDHESESVPLGLFEPPTEPGHLGRLGPYDIIRVVGRGGMGIVFQGRDRALDRLVAIKILTPGLASTAPARRRFAREAKAAAAVVNEHVVAIHAVDATPQGVPYLVMQYVAGKSAQDLIDHGDPPGLCQILRIGMQAAEGLAAAHAQGLIHRDIKPANILLENGVERVKITDFGLARAVDDATMTQSGTIAGTPRYMAPEQARGDAIDHRADLFSLGSVLYALCTGRAPFQASSSVATLKKVCEETPTPIAALNPEIPGWLIRVIERLHAKNAADRFGSAAEVADLLARCLAHAQEPAMVPLPPELVERTKRGSFTRWAIAASVLCCGLVALAGKTAVGEQVVEYVATVLRLKTPEGYLIVETDDPNVSIKVDDSILVVTGAGVKELRLPVGPHSIQAIKGGATLKDELVTITHGGRKTLSVRREGDGAASRESPTTSLAGTNAATSEVEAVMEHDPRNRIDNTRPALAHAVIQKPANETMRTSFLLWLTQGAVSVPKQIEPLSILPGAASEVRTVAFSPDGKRLAAGAMNGTLDLWEITPAGAANEFCRVKGHENGVTSVAFSPDSKRLVTGGRDRRVKLWDVSGTGPSVAPLWNWLGRPKGGWPVAFSPDGTKIARGSHDGYVTILDAQTAKELSWSSVPERPIHDVKFSPDGKVLALALGSVTATDGEVQIWDWRDNRLVRKIAGWDGECLSVAFSPDGRHLAATSGSGALRILLGPEFVVQEVSNHTGKAMLCVAYRPDGNMLATSTEAGNLVFWDPATGKHLGMLKDAHNARIAALAFAPGGLILATASADGLVKLWDVRVFGADGK